jgi:hypothetical protein
VLVSIITPELEAVRATINTVLALIRGDWGKAWDEIRKVPGLMFEALVVIIKGLGGLLWDATTAVGTDIVKGIIQGIKDAPSIGQAIVDKIKGPSGLELLKKAIESHSPSMLFAREIGEPISEGIAQGIIDKQKAITDALLEVASKAVDDAKALVQSSVGQLSGLLSTGFDAEQGDVKTPAEKRIAQIQAAQSQQALDDQLASARKALADARLVKDTSDRKAAEAAALKQIHDANAAITMAALEKQAAIERTNLDSRQKVEKMNFDARLAQLNDFLTSGEASASEASARITAFMKEFGLSMADLGALLGVSFADGLRSQIPAAVKAAQDLADSIAAKKVLDTRSAAEAAAGDVLMTKAKAAEKAIANQDKAIEDAVAKAIATIAAQKAKATKGATGATGAAGDASSTYSGSLMGADAVMAPFAAQGASYGLRVTSGLRSPEQNRAVGGSPTSDHLIGKALDMADGPSSMAAFFTSLIGNPRVKQAFYDPLGSIFGGVRNSYVEGNHSDHVHVATYDKGGWLHPGWNLAYNGLGRKEAVGGGSAVFNVNVGGETLVQIVWDGVRRKAQVFERQNGRTAF